MEEQAFTNTYSERELNGSGALLAELLEEKQFQEEGLLDNKGIIITQTPFRVSFFGGGTDFSDYFNKYGGAVIGCSINKYLYVTLNSLTRFLNKRIRLSYSKHEQANYADEIQHKQVKAILQRHPFFDDRNFLDIHTFADLPASSGMGSSSSFTVGMLNDLYLINNIYKTPESLAKEAIHIEREILKEKGGWQDQIFAAYGGFNRIDFYDNSFRVTPVLLSQEKQKALESSCMLFFTNMLRQSNDIQKNVVDSDESNRVKCLNQIREYVERAFFVLKHSSSSEQLVREFGQLLAQTWEAKRNLSNSVSNEQVDRMYQLGMDAGAYGGKLCGAGNGGFVLFVVPEEKRATVADALKEYKRINISFESHGSRPIYTKRVTD